MKKITQYFFLAMGVSLHMQTSFAAEPPFTVKNNSSFYIFSKESGAGCPKMIAPGEEAKSTEYWCGFVACATKNYDTEKGCLEQNSDKTGLTEGGYATWFSISFGNELCTVPASNIYQCAWKKGALSFDYKNITQVYSAGPNIGKPVEISQPATYTKGPQFRGVNLSGLEYDGTFLDAMYQHPDLPDMRYFVKQGMNLVRLPIRWEFILSSDEKNFVESHNSQSPYINKMYLDAVYDTVKKYLQRRLAVDLDLHNYMRFCQAGAEIGQADEPTDPVVNNCAVVTSEQLTYIWGVIAKRFADLANQYPNLLMFEIMNEPFTHVDKEGKPVPGQILKTQDLFLMEVAAAKEIRKYAKENYIILSGNYWDPLHGWSTESPFPDDVPNGTIFTAKNLKAQGINDTGRIILDMHQYFDDNYSGTHPECKKFDSYTHFKQVLALEDTTGKDIFGNWLKDNGLKVLLGEFGASNMDNCKEDLNYMLRYVNEHAFDASKPEDGGFIAWSAWRTNRHGGNVGFAPFNYLQAEDYTVYAANGTKEASQPGTGIVKGLDNSLMLPDPVFSFLNYLAPQLPRS